MACMRLGRGGRISRATFFYSEKREVPKPRVLASILPPHDPRAAPHLCGANGHNIVLQLHASHLYYGASSTWAILLQRVPLLLVCYAYSLALTDALVTI